MGPTFFQMLLVHKTGNTKRIKTTPEEDRATVTGCNNTKKFGKFAVCGF